MRSRIEVLGYPMDPMTMLETLDEIEQRLEKEQFTQHVAVNVAKLVKMRNNPSLDDCVRNCDIINIDGTGVVLGARFLGHKVPQRVAGVDLFHELLAMSARKDYSVYLLGATDEVVKTTAEQIRILFPNLKLVGYHHGYFWDNEEALVEEIRTSGAELLFVAITSPKKEHFCNRWRDHLGVKFIMGVGGTFDIVAGKVKRSPQWMQRWGLEWFYRLLQEPHRMWRRYLVTNTQFAFLILREKLVQLRKN